MCISSKQQYFIITTLASSVANWPPKFICISFSVLGPSQNHKVGDFILLFFSALTPSVKWAKDPSSCLRGKSKKTKGPSNAPRTLCEGFISNLGGFWGSTILQANEMKIIN